MKRQYDIQGFTLIEALAVMVVVGVLSAIAAPSFLGFLDNQKLSSTKSLLFTSLKAAQSEAKRTKKNQSITISADKIAGKKIDDGISISGSSLPATIVFNPSGSPISLNGYSFEPVSFQVNSPNGSKCLSISTLLGAIATNEGACGSL